MTAVAAAAYSPFSSNDLLDDVRPATSIWPATYTMPTLAANDGAPMLPVAVAKSHNRVELWQAAIAVRFA
ncbi:hypothetical protein PY650_34745 [Rhizobium calliandrae]|uniref:Uncharacterized protein n=1 Tax=Rhizobium calliandrae TaxID=1312182 RepID=A0ABT7KPT5_9HYPH|nr:hypothetical protein [Rhizobium calliandrae]MDL2410639.1 hypothetical protein [Rhizobium calliandrae]